MVKRKRRKLKKSGLLILIIFSVLCGALVFSLTKKKESPKTNEQPKNEETTPKVDPQVEQQEKEKQVKYEECMKQPYRMESLDQEFNDLFASYQNLDLGIYFTEINNDYSYSLNPNKGYYSGCVVKLFSVIYLVEKARAGELDLHSTLTYLPEDKHAFSDMTDKHNFYDKIPIIDLIRYMLTISDNSAYFIIVRNFGAQTFNDYFRDKYNVSLHFTNKHPFESNYTAALGNRSLELLYEVLKTDDEASKVIREAMSNEVENTLNFDDVKFLHKYGEYDVWHNDIGIYDTDNPYLISILTTRAYTDYKTMIPKVNKDIYTIYKKNLDSKEQYCRGLAQ